MKFALRIALMAIMFVVPCAAQAEKDEKKSKVETEHLFGFLVGADTGEVGEKEIEGGYSGRFKKRSGAYSARSQEAEFEFVPIENLRVSAGGSLAQNRIRGVDGLEDAKRSGFQSLFLDMRYGLLERARSGVGVAIAAQPRWARMDSVTGERAREYGLDILLVADTEIVPGNVIAAANLIYEIEAARPRSARSWEWETGLGVATALMARVQGSLFIGGEARYLRRYEGSQLDSLAGHAVFVGPTLFTKITENSWVSASWSVQVAGRAAQSRGSLDLENFERHEVSLKFGYNF